MSSTTSPDMDTLGRVFADLADWMTHGTKEVPDLTVMRIGWDFAKRLWMVEGQLATTYATEVEQIDAIRTWSGRGGVLTLSEPSKSSFGYRFRTLSAWHWWGPYQITIWTHIDREPIPELVSNAA